MIGAIAASVAALVLVLLGMAFIVWLASGIAAGSWFAFALVIAFVVVMTAISSKPDDFGPG